MPFITGSHVVRTKEVPFYVKFGMLSTLNERGRPGKDV